MIEEDQASLLFSKDLSTPTHRLLDQMGGALTVTHREEIPRENKKEWAVLVVL